MSGGRSSRHAGLVAGLGALFVLALAAAQPVAASVPAYVYATPIFGLATAPDGSILVADAGAGIVELRKGAAVLIADLPGVTDVAPIGRGGMYAVTGAGEGDMAWKLFRVSRGSVQPIADLLAFETNVNPDGGAIDSNPFDVAALATGKVLVADAGGNDLLIVDQRGNVDWIAVLPDELVSTANAKSLAGCPTPPDELAFVCGLPEMIPAQPVATSVAVGPDGTLYVTEIDEKSFLAVEFLFFGLPFPGVGGTVNACDSGSWTCEVVATGLPIVIGTTVGTDGTVYAAVKALIPGEAEVIALP